MIQELAVAYAIHFLVGELATAGTTFNWTDAKAKVMALVAANVHNAWLASEAGKAVSVIIDAAAKLCEENTATEALLKDLAAKDWQAAELELKSELSTVLPAELAKALVA